MGALDGKTALVTGAGSGIGRAAALALAGEGAYVLVAGRREAPLAETVAAIEATGGGALARSVDLEDGDAAAALGRWAIEQRGRVDVLVNNAGHSTRVRSLRHVDPEEWTSVFRVNVEGVYRLTQSLLEPMIAQGEGTVITVSSMAGLSPSLLGGIPYGAAKAASHNLTRGMNAELRKYGIRACVISPGEANTPILDKRPQPPAAEARETMMQPEDVAEAIVLCATMPQRTLVEQIVMMPTVPRDVSAEVEAAAGPPEG